jgi:hypothetical protein
MMQRYAHLDPAAVRASVNLLAALYPTGRETSGEAISGANGHQNGHTHAATAPAEAHEAAASA